MTNKYLLLFISGFLAALSGCTTTRVEIAGLPGHYAEERTLLPGFAGYRKKDKLLLASYPPGELTDGLKNYRLRYHSWPRSFPDLFSFSTNAKKAVSDMLSTHYANLQMNWQSPDSLEIFYEYSPRTHDQKRNDQQIILNEKVYKRKYIFLYRPDDGSVLTENRNLK